MGKSNSFLQDSTIGVFDSIDDDQFDCISPLTSWTWCLQWGRQGCWFHFAPQNFAPPFWNSAKKQEMWWKSVDHNENNPSEVKDLTWDLHQRMKISDTILKSSVESEVGFFSHLDLSRREGSWLKALPPNGAYLFLLILIFIDTCCCPRNEWAWGKKRTGPCKGQQTHPGSAARPPGCRPCSQPLSSPPQPQPSLSSSSASPVWGGSEFVRGLLLPC